MFPTIMGNRLASKFRRITSTGNYLPEIDGIRFLSLSLVVLFHIRGYFLERTPVVFTDQPTSYRLFNIFLNNTNRSVPLFFVISGFILSLPFANHYINGSKAISLKNYYLRRLTRLEPPYFIIITILFLTQLTLHIYPFRVLFPSLLASFFYSHDLIYHHTPLVTVVAWTLEIEIQFYLIAPFVFRIFALPALWRRSIIVCAIVLFIILQMVFPPGFRNLYACIHHFLTGILVADMYICGTWRRFFSLKWTAWLALASFLAIFYMPLGRSHGIIAIVDRFVLPLTIGLFYCIILNNETVKKLFSYKFIPIIGGMCYTIYLLHYSVISMVGKYTVNIKLTTWYLPNLLLQFALLGAAVLLVSAVFYLCFERPFMDRKWVDRLLQKNK